MNFIIDLTTPVPSPAKTIAMASNDQVISASNQVNTVEISKANAIAGEATGISKFREYLSQNIDSDEQFMKKRSEYASKIISYFEQYVVKQSLNLKVEFNKRFASKAGSFQGNKIVLSTKIIISWERLKQTVLHELCHAAVKYVSQVNDNHGPFFHKWAIICDIHLGVLIPTRHTYDIKFKHVYKCSSCGIDHSRNRAMDISRKVCKCRGKIIKLN